MEFTCKQSDLNSTLSLVSRAISNKPSHPVLGNVLIQATDDRVTLTGFDLRLGIQIEIEEVAVITPGSFTLPAKLFADIIAKLPNEQIEIKVTGQDEGAIATIKASSGKYEVRGISAGEYPELPEIEVERSISIPVNTLQAGIKQCLFSSSYDETKQVLTGIHFTLGNETLEFASTDGHRLSIRTELVEDGSEAELTIPNKSLAELEKMCNALGQDTAVIQMETSQVNILLGKHRLFSMVLEGMYPSYRKLIPQQFARTVTVDRKVLIESVERIAVIADQKNNLVKLTLDSENQRLTLAVEAADVGCGAESISTQISGEDLEIGFNIKYLLEGLKSFQSSEVQMQMNTNLSPVIVTPLDGTRSTYLIMPVQIRK